MTAAVQSREAAERFAGAGGDDIRVRLVTAGDDPLTVVEGVSADAEWALLHSHPWDEMTYVLEGTMEFRVGDQYASGGPGTLVSLPRGIPHSLRVPDGEARYLLITLGAPSLDFFKEVGRIYAEGPTFDRLVAAARKHGIVPVLENA
jgi:quercetin dioxygenase-like cupin family protein